LTGKERDAPRSRWPFEAGVLGAGLVALGLVAWHLGTFERERVAETVVEARSTISLDPSTLARNVAYTAPFAITRPSRIDVRLRASTRHPTDALVSLVETRTDEVHEADAVLDGEGSVAFDGVAPGDYHLRLVAASAAAPGPAAPRVRLVAWASGGSWSALLAAAALLALPLLASIRRGRGRVASHHDPQM
jgi:hypothetical protein